MSERTYDEIMRDIESGLSGDPREDYDYLMNMADVYREHSRAKDIHKAIGRLIYSLMPAEGQAKFADVLEKERKQFLEKLENIRFRMFREQYEEALKDAEELVSLAESGLYADDETGTYFSFDEAFEEVLYTIIHQPLKEVRRASVPMSRIYGTYGILLVELGRVEEARKALEKGLKWNPCDMEIRTEYAETSKMQGNMEAYLEQVLENIKYCFRPKYLARAYRDLGYYFIERKQYSEATFLYYLSMRWEPESKQAASELFYIEQKAEEEIHALRTDEIKALSETYEFPVGPDPRILSAAYQLGKHSLEHHEPGAEYYLQIVYDLTKDEEVVKLNWRDE